MRLLVAGSFGGIKLRRTLYAAPEAVDVLLSAGWDNSRETAEILANGKERMEIYAAALGNGDTLWESVRAGGIQNILCSFGHGTSRQTADHFSKRDRKSDMKLFIAGNREPVFQHTVCDAAGKYDMLCSNANKSAQEVADDFVQRFEYHLLIDSGAFTAWKQGKPIDLQDYIAYAKKLSADSQCPVEFIALDVIAGSFDGPAPTQADLKAACQKGYENWKEMEAAGVPCIPTFHRGDEHFEDPTHENWYWLEKIASEIIPGGRLCIAPKADGAHVEVKMAWLDKVFRQLDALNTELNAAQGVSLKLWERWRIHGLGVSSQPIMEAYPWYSVDSTGWLFSLTSLAYRYFDGKRIQARQKKDGWRDGKYDDEISLMCQEHDWPAANHKFTYNPPPLFEEHAEIPLCEVCSKPEQGHEEAKEEIPDGYYWFGTEAIKADVKLAEHVTRYWQLRGVYFDEDRITAPDTSIDPRWQHFDGHKPADQQDVEYLDESVSNGTEKYESTIDEKLSQREHTPHDADGFLQATPTATGTKLQN